MILPSGLRDLGAHLVAEHTEPVPLAWAVAIGIFVGCTPLWGLHLPLCIAIGFLLKLNKVTLYLAANISNPITGPLIVAANIAVGEWLRYGTWRPIEMSADSEIMDKLALWSGQVSDLFVSCLLGGAIVGGVLGALGGLATWMWAVKRQPVARPDSSPVD